MVVTRGEGGGGRMKRGKGLKYMVMGGDYTLGGEHTTQYRDDVLYRIVHLKLI